MSAKNVLNIDNNFAKLEDAIMKRNGFTLIELLVVVGIIGLLHPKGDDTQALVVLVGGTILLWI